MVDLLALWKPILVSAVFVFLTMAVTHMIPGWHQRDMKAVPGEDRVMDTLRALNVTPGEYRFPFGATTKEMEAPEFVLKMKSGPVGSMTIRPTGELPFGRMMGLWFVYSVVISGIAACVAGAVHGPGAPFEAVVTLTGIIAFCCYVVAHWQNWIWWGRSTRITLTYSVDGLLYAIVTGATFGWLWP
jgi:hypothetical protein